MEGQAAAGSGGIVEDYVKGHVVVHRRALPKHDEVVAVTVSGDSMEPALPDGSIVAIDRRRRDPQKLKGKIIACRTGEESEVVIKRLAAVKRCLILTSDNDQAAPDERIIEVDPREVEKPIIGQVVWAWTPQDDAYKI